MDQLSTHKLAELYESILKQEAIDMPPAIVQNQQQFSPKLVNFVKSVENGNKKGYKGGKWYPYRVSSTEIDIGYGHKITKGENFAAGITDAQAEQLLSKDLSTAYNNAKQYVDKVFGKGTFDKMDVTRREMLTDYAYNLGSLNGFPKFTKAVVQNNLDDMRKEYIRYAVIDGVKTRLGRNNHFYDAYLKNYTGGYYLASN